MAKSTPQQTSKKKTLREKAEKQKKASVKAVLQNPFKTIWPSIPHEKQQEVLEYLERVLKPLEDTNRQNGKKKKNRGESKVEEEEVDPVVQKIRSEFVLGVNSVTRMLENDKLSLVLVCKSAHPPIIVKHLAELSSVRCCPAMLLTGLDTLLCAKLKIRSAVAIGFKKRKNGWFKEFISSVDPPEIQFPYLNDHLAKFIIDKKGQRTPGQFGCENTSVRKESNTLHRNKRSFGQNETPLTVPAETGISKNWRQKAVSKKEKKEKNPFKSNENFISLGSVSDDEGLKGLDLKLRHAKTQDSIWDEIFAMRIVEKESSKGVPIHRDDVHPVEISLLKTATLGLQKTGRGRSLSGGKWERDSKSDFHRNKKFKIWEEKPEYRVSEIRRIKGNVEKKKSKRKRSKKSVKQNTEIIERSDNKRDNKEKSHLNKKKKSRMDKLKKEWKKMNKMNNLVV